MGKKQHIKDRMYLTKTEWATEWGGAKSKELRTPFKRLPVYCCALTFTPFEDAVCTEDGSVFDIICIEEDQMIVSFTLSKDNKYLLVSLVNEELHLWNIQGHIRLVAKYKGHRRSQFIVRACFGGLDQSFIASGSEDSQVYIWHRGSGELIETLEGHSRAVNCISWNPANPHMLASASDDRSIRIWGLKQLHVKQKGKGKLVSGNENGNGVHYCNGATT